MKITVVWKDPTGRWHIGERVYGPTFWALHSEPLHDGSEPIEVFERTGFWQGRPDGILWTLHPTEIRELEAI